MILHIQRIWKSRDFWSVVFTQFKLLLCIIETWHVSHEIIFEITQRFPSRQLCFSNSRALWRSSGTVDHPWQLLADILRDLKFLTASTDSLEMVLKITLPTKNSLGIALLRQDRELLELYRPKLNYPRDKPNALGVSQAFRWPRNCGCPKFCDYNPGRMPHHLLSRQFYVSRFFRSLRQFHGYQTLFFPT